MAFIPWHYLGAIDCLVNGKPTIADTVQQDALDKMTKALAALPSNVLKAVIGGVEAPDGEPLLFDVVRQVVTPAVRPELAWDRKLAGLKVRVVRIAKDLQGKDISRELILTPTTLYIPWPFFQASIPRPARTSIDAAGEGLVRDFDTDVLNGPFMMVSTALDAADYLADCDRDTARQTADPAARRKTLRELIVERAKKKGKAHKLGTFTATPQLMTPKIETSIKVENDTIHLDLGLADNPRLKADDSEGPPLAPPFVRYPCGSIDAMDRDCSQG